MVKASQRTALFRSPWIGDAHAWGTPASARHSCAEPKMPSPLWSQRPRASSTSPTSTRRRRDDIAVRGHPGIDLSPSSFEPGHQPIRRRNTGGRYHNGVDEQLPMDGQLPPWPRPPIRAETVVRHHEHVGARRSRYRGGGAAAARWQRVRLPQRAARGAKSAG